MKSVEIIQAIWRAAVLLISACRHSKAFDADISSR